MKRTVPINFAVLLQVACEGPDPLRRPWEISKQIKRSIAGFKPDWSNYGVNRTTEVYIPPHLKEDFIKALRNLKMILIAADDLTMPEALELATKTATEKGVDPHLVRSRVEKHHYDLISETKKYPLLCMTLEASFLEEN